MPSAAKKVKGAGDRSAEALPRLSGVTDRIRARPMQRADALARCAEAGGTGGQRQYRCALRTPALAARKDSRPQKMSFGHPFEK
jgi:hypothetical protein